MWLILCSSTDLSALWAYQGLRTRGLAPLELITAEMLASALRSEHRVGVDGASIDIILSDGRRICDRQICGVLNRLSYLPPEHFCLVHPAERDYATQELTAFFLSWLYTLPQPTINRATPQGLSGQWRHLSEWLWLAAKAGLPTPRYRQSSHDPDNPDYEKTTPVLSNVEIRTILMVANQIVGASLPPKLRPGCQRLASFAGTDLLGIDFAIDAEGCWTFVGATSLPDLRVGGEALLDILASVFTHQQEVSV